jgi:hypothetical protein
MLGMDVRMAYGVAKRKDRFRCQQGKTVVEHILALLPIWIAVVGALLWIAAQLNSTVGDAVNGLGIHP